MQGGLNIPLCHVVRIDVVVDVFMPFIGSDHIVDFIIMPLRIIFCPVGPELCRAEQNLLPVVPHKLVVPRYVPVLPDGIGDTGRNMQFYRAVQNWYEFSALRVNDQSRSSFLSIQRTLPRVLCTLTTAL